MDQFRQATPKDLELLLEEHPNERCFRCKFFEGDVLEMRTPDGLSFEMFSIHGHCHRFPPSIYNTQDPDDPGESVFPFISGTQWCGEFSPSPTFEPAQLLAIQP